MTAVIAGPLDELTRLHRAGALAAEHPRVAGLLAELTEVDLRRAGALLARLDPDAVLAAHPRTPVVSIAVTGHGTLGPLVPALAAELGRHGLLPRPHVSTFDSWVQDLSDPGSALLRAGTDLVCCVLDPMVVADELPVPWRPADAAAVLDAKLRLVDGLAGRYAAAGPGMLVLNTLPLPRTLTGQLVDHRGRAELGALWREFNAALLRLGAAHPSLVVLDLDPLLAAGVPATEPRMSVYAKAHLSADLLAGYAREVGHLARAVAGRTKKALVLDLDNTVWGGVVGDDGVDGIEVGEGHRGAAYAAFQRVAKQIGAQGVLLAAVSKNDPEPVARALAEHPGMVLREPDLVRVTANWRPKPDNLRELAADLNLGVDSFVFADDSDYERALVRRELPGVAVVDLDGEPALHVARLLADGWFDTRELTAEDRARPAAYRREAARSDFLRGADSVADYLRELGITVRVSPVTARELPRVSQLTLRTNQFNLTTERLQPAQVQALLDDPAALTLAVHAGDRFGDHGLVGAVLARRHGGTGAGGTLAIDNMVLSCRVFSRGIEQGVLAALLRHAADTGATAVTGSYRPSPRNGIVADFYPRHGFTAAGTDDDIDDGTDRWRHDLADIPAVPAHLELTTDWGAA
jgi:FkbH-like protein